MTDRAIDLQAIRERLSKAKPGPYHVRRIEGEWVVYGLGDVPFVQTIETRLLGLSMQARLDTDFLAHSWQDITDLLALADVLVEAMEKAYYARTYWDAKLLIGDALAAAQPAIDAVKGRETDG